MEVTLVVSERCAPHDEVRALIKEALEESGAGDIEVEETEIRTDEEAIPVDCIGSPTIRVNGLDVEYLEREPDERSAGQRYFNSPAGWKKLPEKGLILRALEQAKANESSE
jgi:hypothetical protein